MSSVIRKISQEHVKHTKNNGQTGSTLSAALLLYSCKCKTLHLCHFREDTPPHHSILPTGMSCFESAPFSTKEAIQGTALPNEDWMKKRQPTLLTLCIVDTQPKQWRSLAPQQSDIARGQVQLKYWSVHVLGPKDEITVMRDSKRMVQLFSSVHHLQQEGTWSLIKDERRTSEALSATAESIISNRLGYYSEYDECYTISLCFFVSMQSRLLVIMFAAHLTMIKEH